MEAFRVVSAKETSESKLLLNSWGIVEISVTMEGLKDAGVVIPTSS